MTSCPLISKLESSSKNSAENSEADVAENEDNPYKIPDKNVKSSKFIEKQKEQERLRGLDKFVLWGGSAIDTSDVSSQDDNINRVHAWVVVKVQMNAYYT